MQAEVASVQDVAPINAWASKVTNGLISQAVPPGLDFNLLITNAVYFKGLWEFPFDKSRAKQQPFKALAKDGSTKVRATACRNTLMMGCLSLRL